MNRYTIYCNAEQTKKAFKLGAPLSVITAKNEKVIAAYKAFANGKRKNECTILDDFQQSGCCHLITNPTAEQMIGFILESGRGYSTDLSKLIREQGYKQGCLTFIDSCLK